MSLIVFYSHFISFNKFLRIQQIESFLKHEPKLPAMSQHSVVEITGIAFICKLFAIHCTNRCNLQRIV